MLQQRYLVLLVMACVAILVTSLLPAIPQDVLYHAFADQRAYLGLANFLNVVSNIPFLIFGAMGIYGLFKRRNLFIIHALKPAYGVFFISVALVGLGSSYYHLQPNNFTLLWDRLPMALAFMSFFTIVLGEYLDEAIAGKLFYPLLITGALSVMYWYWTETIGQGDLRLYILVQFLPVILIPFILWACSSRFTHGHYYWIIIACYVLAKVLELTDAWVFDVSDLVSGHSIKHLVSALAAYVFYLMLRKRHVTGKGW